MTISVVWSIVDMIVGVLQPGDLPINCYAIMWFTNLFIPMIPVVRFFFLSLCRTAAFG